MLRKVEPAAEGIPHAINVFIKNIRATHAKKIFEVSGLPASLLESFSFENTTVSAETMGQLEFIKD